MTFQQSIDAGWTKALTEIAIDLWNKGLSGTQIGDHIGKTRNAVIGKLNRMGLTRHDKPHMTKAKSTIRIRKRPKNYRPAPTPVITADHVLGPRPPPAPAPQDGISLIQLHYYVHCAYPIHGHGADTRYCGAGTQGKTYCAQHQKIMYEPAKTPVNRRLRPKR